MSHRSNRLGGVAQHTRTVGTSGPNNRLDFPCFWFDLDASPALSNGGLGNRSTTLMVPASTRASARTDSPALRRMFGRMGLLLKTRVLPVAALSCLVVWQLDALASELRQLNAHPGWIVLGECARSVLYALFLCFPIAAFLTHEPPLSRDPRLLVTCAAITATFLLPALGLLAPDGPVLWQTTPELLCVAIGLSLIGVGLAVVSAQSLGACFSFDPQGRALVVRGPYRLVRHPIYLSELGMIVGITIVNPRVVPLVGACAVIALQVVRIRAEERLLRSTFPAFSSYAVATRYRLIPPLW